MSYLYASDFSFKNVCKLAQYAEKIRKKCLGKQKCLKKPSTSNSTIRLRALERKPNWDRLLLNNIVKTMFGVQYEFSAVFSRNRNVLWSSRTMISSSGVQSRLVTIDILIFLVFRQPGVVAHACNPVTWRLVSLNGLRAGFLGVIVLCRSSVRAKFGVSGFSVI